MYIIFCFGKKHVSFLKRLQTSELVSSLRRNPLVGRVIRSPLEQDTQQCHCKPAGIYTHKLCLHQAVEVKSRATSTANTTVHASSCTHRGAMNELSALVNDYCTVPFHLRIPPAKWCDRGTLGHLLRRKSLTTLPQWQS